MATCREEATPPPPGVQRIGKPGRWAGGDDSELDVFRAERYFNGEDALWCAGSSSSVSSAFRTGTHGMSVATATAATSSSESSWNSRSALLPNDGKVLAAAAGGPSVVEAERRGKGNEQPRAKPSSHLRRWLLGVPGCGCVGGQGEESASSDGWSRDEDDNFGKNVTNTASELVKRTESKKLGVVEATSVRVRPGSGQEVLAGKAALFSPVQAQLTGNGQRRPINSGDQFPATTAALLHEHRRRSSEMLRPQGDTGSALLSMNQDSASFTIVAGNTARSGSLHTAAAAGGGRPALARRPCVGSCNTSDNDVAPSVLGCAYPPSEASVVWSVVTAEGAASCNMSSAASGYHYRVIGNEDDALRHAAGRSNRRRRSGVINSGGLLTCIGDKAVNAVGPDRRLGPKADGRAALDG